MSYRKANMRASAAARSARSKRSATARQCPSCGRKGALRRDVAENAPPPVVFYECRWCGWAGSGDELRAMRKGA